MKLLEYVVDCTIRVVHNHEKSLMVGICLWIPWARIQTGQKPFDAKKELKGGHKFYWFFNVTSIFACLFYLQTNVWWEEIWFGNYQEPWKAYEFVQININRWRAITVHHIRNVYKSSAILVHAVLSLFNLALSSRPPFQKIISCITCNESNSSRRSTV